MPPQIIDKGIPTAGLLVAHVLGTKYQEHVPLSRQSGISKNCMRTTKARLPKKR